MLTNEDPNVVSSADESGYMRVKNNLLKKWSKLLFQSKTGTFGLFIVITVIIIALIARFIAPYDPSLQDVTNVSQPPAWLEGGNISHILGTDNMGRDILSRVIYGTRISLLIGVCSVLIAGIIGVIVGLIAGYYGGFIDNVLMRLVDSFLAIPNILLAIVILGVLGPNMVTLILVLGITNWVVYARMVRGHVLTLKEAGFVKAAVSLGVKDNKIITRHLLPNIMSDFIVISTLTIATAIIAEASLSFLGLGIQPPDISWGLMLSDGRDHISTSWWIATFSGLALTITVLGIMFLGDWLRDVLDPKSKER